MSARRVIRINSLLKEVIAKVIHRDVKHPKISGQCISVTSVSASSDLGYAKVYITVLGSEEEQKEVLAALKSARGFIALRSAQEVTLRYFPVLMFYADNSVAFEYQIESLFYKIQLERAANMNNEEEILETITANC
ncbi:Ribosome-binding factor A [Candidatus Clavichlamydia salmonicola]|uniref:30S ribosome-binding factor RbfA n=1 Tax=Candidatus Clavichlamydia salmonicola TaxID=469812 RepID=UPI001891608F|nr:30S ribosome-binding factor RbfA [Candidatus Clavichlamydia salmonicola]MBF5051197.1 Ribosome-binding factor A [Candidatus Clavichlamydia salmonicola]